MTKILIDLATAQQALDALKEFGYHGSSPRWERTANDLKAALEQQPVQEPTPWRDMVVVSLVREGINKHKARELADHFATPPLPVQEPANASTWWTLVICAAAELENAATCLRDEDAKRSAISGAKYYRDAAKALRAAPQQQQTGSVSMRMPKVGDRIVCLEDESLGKVVSLTAGGSPDITFDDGSHGTYLLREFFELFGYVNSHQQQAEPLAWLYPEGLEALQNGKCWTAYPTEHEDCKIPLYTTPQQQQAEPVTWDKPSASFDEWWDGDRRRDNANPFTTDSFAYWAWEGWQAAQRPWVGLTKQDMPSGEDPMFDHPYFIAGMVYAATVLKERNT